MYPKGNYVCKDRHVLISEVITMPIFLIYLTKYWRHSVMFLIDVVATNNLLLLSNNS